MTGSARRLLWIACLFAGIESSGPAAALLFAQPVNPAEEARRAAELVRTGKPDEAIPIYRALAAASPNELSFGVNLVIAEYKAGRYRDAVEQCHKLLKINPNLFPAWVFLGASHLELGEAASALEPLEKAVSLQPGDRNARVMLADALLARGKNWDAAARFEESAKVMPDSPRVLYGLARAYKALTADALQRLEKEAPGSPEMLALGADFEMERGQFARALQRYRLALNLRPSFPGIHEAISQVYENTGHSDWAAVERAREQPTPAACDSQSPACQFAGGHLREIVMATATSPEAIYWQAKSLSGLSGQAYSRLQQFPPSPEKHEAAARANELKARYPEAAAAWKKALELSPRNARIQRQLALALCRANDCVSALPLAQDLLAREPASAELNYLYGLALNATQNPGRALPYLEAAVKLDGTFLPARAALGEAYLLAGKPERAIPHLEAALREDEDGSRHYQLARACQAAGRQDQAAAVLRDYREILRRREQADKEEPRITPP